SVVRTNSVGGTASLRIGTPFLEVTGIAISVNPFSVVPTPLQFVSTNGSIPPPQMVFVLPAQPSGVTATARVISPVGINWLTIAVLPPGTNNVLVNANPAGQPQGSYSGAVTISAIGNSTFTRTVPVTFQVNGPTLQVTTGCPLPSVREGGILSPVPLTATGGTGSYTFSILGGLPSSLVVANGAIGGILTVPPGSYPFTIQVTDGQQTAQQQCGITVMQAPVSISGTCPA